MSESKRFPPEKIAKLDNEERRAHQPAAPLVDLVAEGRPRRVLEVGVGTGYFAILIAETLPEAEVIGLDVEPQMLEIFTNRAAARLDPGRARTVQATAEEVAALEPDSVDLVLMANLYHELDHRDAALSEARRLLRPGGRLIICDWDPEASADFGPPADHRLDRDIVAAELTKAGFSTVEPRPLYEDLYTLVATL